MSKKHVAIGAGVLVLIGAAVTAWNETENAAARAELDEACACARRSVHETLVASALILRELFEDDEPMVRSFLREEVVALCGELRAELAPWRWNLGRTFTPARDPERAAEMREILARARPHCPQVFHVGEARANELCDTLFSGLAPSAEPAEPVSAWAWPEGIRSSMCSVENGARANAPHRP